MIASFEKPTRYQTDYEIAYAMAYDGGDYGFNDYGVGRAGSPSQPKYEPRKEFPETWLWLDGETK